jgi:glycosyltransferase involved in cell wall biosynthesis
MKIVISWNELPKYAAYPLAKIIKDNSQIEVISIRSKLPIYNLEKIINKKIHWVENKNYKWKDLNLDIPEIFFQAGWYKKSFSSLGKEVKKNGGKVVLMSDNPFKNNYRQIVGSFIFKLKYPEYFDAVWVPGKLGKKLMRYYSFPQKKIFMGLYSSNPKIFQKGISINRRPKNFLFVGQLIKEKGLVELLNAFKKFFIKKSNWNLIIVGNGSLKNKIPKHDNIKHYNFKTPQQISKLMQKSRFLVLPTYSDHWPLVINEATLCGCGLITTNIVGNIPELVKIKNSILCKPFSERSLLYAIKKASELSDSKLKMMHKESLKLSLKFVDSEWVKNFYNIINYLKTSV